MNPDSSGTEGATICSLRSYIVSRLCSVRREKREGEGAEGTEREREMERRGREKEVCRTAASSPFMIHDREAPTEAQ